MAPTPRRCCAASIPPDHPVLGLDGATTPRSATLDAGAAGRGRRICCRRCRTCSTRPARAGCPGSWHGCAQPGGCPWDREQDHLSLRPFLLEETYEVYDALEDGSDAEAGRGAGRPAAPDRAPRRSTRPRRASSTWRMSSASIMTKIVRRHPHVFGDGAARTAGEVMRNWEQHQGRRARRRGRRRGGAGQAARATRTCPPPSPGLSQSLPALAYADEMQDRAASLGYDWPDLEGVIDKVAEEATRAAGAPTTSRARTRSTATCCSCSSTWAASWASTRRPRCGPPAASSRRASRASSGSRTSSGLELRALGLDALDELWQDAKREEAEARSEHGRAGEGRMSIGGGMRFRADGRTPGQLRPVSIELDVQKWAAASLHLSGRATRTCSAPRPSRTASRRTCGARAPAGSPRSTRCCRRHLGAQQREIGQGQARRPDATRSSASSGGRCAASWTPRCWASAP